MAKEEKKADLEGWIVAILVLGILWFFGISFLFSIL